MEPNRYRNTSTQKPLDSSKPGVVTLIISTSNTSLFQHTKRACNIVALAIAAALGSAPQ
jgi:hypothetical protein